MPYCSVRFCGINNMTEDFRKDNITFHRFPNDPAIKLKWVLAIRLKKERWYPSYASVVCSRHFKEECFQWLNKRKRLLNTAVPTEYLSISYIHRMQNLYTKCKTQSSKPGPKCKRQEKPEADNVYYVILHLNEPAHEFARVPPAPVPLPKVSLPKVPIPKLLTPKAPPAIMPADVRKLNIANKPPPLPVSLVLLAPVNTAHSVANTAENLLVQHDNPNEHKLNHVYPSEVRPEMVLIKEEFIDVASDEQYKPEGFTVTDDNIPYTCDLEIPALKAEPESYNTYGQNYVLPMELPAELSSELLVIKEENTDAELDDINNNVRDFSDKTGEIKMNSANNEIEHMKVSLDNIIWHQAKLPVMYEPRDEFTNYYKNFF